MNISLKSEKTKKGGSKGSPQARAAFKSKVAKVNRYMAWINLPLLLVGSFMIHAWKDGVAGASARSTGSALQGIFIILFFIHTLMSAYLYGIPKPARNIRVMHVYIGYAVFLFVMSSQVFLKTEPLHTILYFLQWVTIAFHIALSTRFLVKRLAKRNADPNLAFYTGGKLLRRAQGES